MAEKRPPHPSFGTIRQRVVLLVVALILFVLTTLTVEMQLHGWFDPVRIRTWIVGFGILAPLVFILVQALQVLIAPIPGQVLGVLAGYLFGPVRGTLIAVAGATLGSLIAFVISRRFGRPFVVRLIGSESMHRFDEVAATAGLPTLFLVFLIPGLPDDVICFAAGLSKMDILKMTIISFVGRLPGYFLAAVAGAGLAAADFYFAAAVLAVLGALSIFGYFYRDAILSFG